ncbi:MAG TPA: alpha/beta hydrolase [Polyangiaceae bacterium]|nr:alpha/beta hydrolase [Polyangiaceae bacterium]
MGFIETEGRINLHYRDWGEGDPVVFVASQAMPCDIWNYNVPFFVERGLRCVTFDRRGHGRSDVPSGGYDLDTLAGDLAAVLRRLDLRGVTLVGHSLGGAEVVRYLARYGAEGRVRRAVLVAPTAPRLTRADDYPEGIDPALAEASADRWRRDFAGWVAENKRGFFTPASSDALVDWGARLMESVPLYVLLAVWKGATTALDLRDDLRGLDLPVLVLHGALDQSVPAAFGEAAAGLVRGAKFCRYDDAAHGIFITHAERFHRDVLGFITSTAP